MTKQQGTKGIACNNWIHLEINIPDIQLIQLDWVIVDNQKIIWQLKKLFLLFVTFSAKPRQQQSQTFTFFDIYGTVCIHTDYRPCNFSICSEEQIQGISQPLPFED